MSANAAATADVTTTAPVSAKDQLAAAKAALAAAKAAAAAERAAAKKAKAEAKAAQTSTRDAKRALAAKVIAAASQIDGLTDDDKATIAHWLHHLPVAHETFTEFLPAPNRSDWR